MQYISSDAGTRLAKAGAAYREAEAKISGETMYTHDFDAYLDARKQFIEASLSAADELIQQGFHEMGDD